MNKKGIFYWDVETMVYSFALMVVLIILGLVITGFFIKEVGATSGKHSGYITAVEKQSGIIYTDYLVYIKSERESSQEDVYCVNDQMVTSELDFAMKTKRFVTVDYSNGFIMWRSECSAANTVIRSVQNAGDTK